MTTTTETPTMQTLAPAIAAALGWTVRPTEDDGDDWRKHWTVLDGADGAALTLSLRDRRLHVYPEWPRGDGSEDYGPSRYSDEGRAARTTITLDPTRPAPILAREITRRVLVGYLAELPRAVARKADDHARKDRQAATARAVAQLVGATVRDDHRGNGTIQLYSPLAHIYEAEVEYAGTITLKLTDLDLKTVVELVRALAAKETD